MLLGKDEVEQFPGSMDAVIRLRQIQMRPIERPPADPHRPHASGATPRPAELMQRAAAAALVRFSLPHPRFTTTKTLG